VRAESTRAGRLWQLEVSPALLRTIASASAASLYVIVVTGALVRLTASGLGCEGWPGCEAGSFFPEDDAHAFVEFGNRIFGVFPITLTLLTWLVARRTAGLPRGATWLSLATFLGTLAQAPLGRLTISFDLHPLLVMSHFLLALLVLGGAVVVALEAWGHERGLAPTFAPRELRLAGLVLAASCLTLVVTGTVTSAAGPHSGGADIRRLWVLDDAVYVHVRTTALFGCVFLFLLGYLASRRSRSPRLFRLALVLLGAVLTQMAVGELQWRTELPWGVVLAHVALAALVWCLTVALVTLLFRPLRSLTTAPA
jgi:heme a synthase